MLPQTDLVVLAPTDQEVQYPTNLLALHLVDLPLLVHVEVEVLPPTDPVVLAPIGQEVLPLVDLALLGQ